MQGRKSFFPLEGERDKKHSPFLPKGGNTQAKGSYLCGEEAGKVPSYGQEGEKPPF